MIDIRFCLHLCETDQLLLFLWETYTTDTTEDTDAKGPVAKDQESQSCHEYPIVNVLGAYQGYQLRSEGYTCYFYNSSAIADNFLL